MKKKYRFAGRQPKQAKVDAITAVYERGDRGVDIARKLSSLTKEKVTGSAVIAFYSRNRALLKDYPLTEPMKFASKRPKDEESEQMKLRLKKARPEPPTHAPLPVRTQETIPPPPVDEIESRKIPMVKLKDRECRWATHETVKDGHLFCGHATKIDKPYCPYHMARNNVRTHREMRAEEERMKAPKLVMIGGSAVA